MPFTPVGTHQVYYDEYGSGNRLAQITSPALVIHGEADPLIPYANGLYLAEHLKGARLLTYPGVGHLPPIEATADFNGAVREFLV